jgi:hypothetical protein
MTTLLQENEGIPNLDSGTRCVLVSRSVDVPHGKFIGYHTFSVYK